MHNYKELTVWQRSMELATLVYNISGNWPQSELYGITAQARRSVVSIASNIAEGAGRTSDKEFAYFLGVAHGSSYELETQLHIARNLSFIETQEFFQLENLVSQIQKMIYSLRKKIKKNS